jgi:hypothetical protein
MKSPAILITHFELTDFLILLLVITSNKCTHISKRKAGALGPCHICPNVSVAVPTFIIRHIGATENQIKPAGNIFYFCFRCCVGGRYR